MNKNWVQCSECGKNGDVEDMVCMGATDGGEGRMVDEFICLDCYDAEEGDPMIILVDEYAYAEQYGEDWREDE